MTQTRSVPFSHVHIVGAGLLGASIGLALREREVSVTLQDASPSALSLALDYGAGVLRTSEHPEPDLVVVAVPPDVVATVVAESLNQFAHSIVIDVASVKKTIADELVNVGADVSRYVGTHPMAGRERGGAVSARSDLFTGRPWVLCDGEPERVADVEALVRSLEATPLRMSASDHDDAVALMSHTPQIVSSLMAARLNGASPEALSLAGGGVRDVTRIAASDAALWTQILHLNAPAITQRLEALAQDLTQLLDALSQIDQAGSRKAVAEILHAGNSGVALLPGKHGVSTKFASLIVVIDDRPGELARLLTQLGEWNVNLEDLRLEHSPGANVGFADLTLGKDVVSDVEQRLLVSGWRIAGETG